MLTQRTANSQRKNRLILAILATALTGSLYGANITQDVNQTGAEDWNTATSWSDDLIPSPGNNYLSVGLDVRTPTSIQTFGGNSLTLGTGSRLVTKNGTGNGATATIPSLILNGGEILAGVDTSGVQYLAGGLTVQTDSFVTLSDSGNRRLVWDGGTLSGSGKLTITGNNTASNFNDIFQIQNVDSSGHTGAIELINARMPIAGGTEIGDTSAVIMTNGRLDIRGNETFGSLAGDAASSVVRDSARNVTLQPQADANYAGTFQSGFGSLTVNGLPGTTQTLTGTSLSIGTVTVNSGTLALQDTGLTTTSSLRTGIAGVGGTIVQNGTSVVTAGNQLQIGYSVGSEGHYILNGGTLNSTVGQVDVGRGDVGTITVNGGTANFTTTFIGVDHDGTLAVNGGAVNAPTLYIGYRGDGVLNHTDGITTVPGSSGVLGHVRLAEQSGSTAVVNFDGGTLNATILVAGRNGNATSNFYMNGGNLNISGDGYATYGGTGTFTQTGGQATFNNFRITNTAAGKGYLNLNGGIFTTSGLTPGPGSITATTMDGGTFRAGSSFSTTAPIVINGGGGTFDSNGNTLSLTGALSGSGPVTKAGAGTVVFSGTNSHTGQVDIAAGTLEIANVGAVGNPSQVHIAAGAEFDVSAISGGGGFTPAGILFSGTGTLNAGATGTINMAGSSIAPGSSPGIMPVVGNLNGLGTYNWQLLDAAGSAGSGWDLTNVSGSYTILPGDTLAIAGLESITPDVAGLPANLDISVRGATTGPFTILDAAGGIAGLASNIAINAGNLASVGYFTLAIVGGTQLQLTFISTVPEPGTWILLAVVLSACLVISRRRDPRPAAA